MCFAWGGRYQNYLLLDPKLIIQVKKKKRVVEEKKARVLITGLQWLAKHPRWPMSGITLSPVSNTNHNRFPHRLRFGFICVVWRQGVILLGEVYRFGETFLWFYPDLKISPEFLCGFLFHLQPKFPRGFPPPTTKIPGDSPQNPRDFARNICLFCLHKGDNSKKVLHSRDHICQFEITKTPNLILMAPLF